MKQTHLELSRRRRRKLVVLDEIEQAICRGGELLMLIAPCAPAAKTGRQPFDQTMMLRIYCLPQWRGLSDPGTEEALFETSLYRDSVGISGTQRIPDRVRTLRFRYPLEEHDLSLKIPQVISAKLAAHGLLLKAGAVVDATLNGAPSSTKNKDGECDPEMHQVKNGNQWHSWMKAHIRVNADSGLAHTVIGTAANVNDVTRGHGLLQGEESVVFADARATEASLWVKVEHPFQANKRQFGHTKVYFRGLKKNTTQLITLFALSNVWIARDGLLQGTLA